MRWFKARRGMDFRRKIFNVQKNTYWLTQDEQKKQASLAKAPSNAPLALFSSNEASVHSEKVKVAQKSASDQGHYFWASLL
ncbi:hypothetical protein [Nodularia sphaerocarpa]|uniref:hypothetical protein n=1 Tax=Nodularia sphaerocarpa TaxID=137816 RepID=UPI00232B2C41|nr:hypothetical protein [Nodularia sphaerocarpa]MDB9372373.1 hypothetical protein [Nodularia sphaerocarpa CS-585]MDB9377989.1 hypothetical protein [Nodularia sphaerocarpa CS-585A2]